MQIDVIPFEWQDAVETGDFNTLAALADYFAEQNYDDAAACLRWVIDKRRWPITLHSWRIWLNWDEVEEETDDYLAAVLPTVIIDLLAKIPGGRWSAVAAFERLIRLWTPALDRAVSGWTPAGLT